MYPICRRKREKRGWSYHLQTLSAAKMFRKMSYFKEKPVMAAKVHHLWWDEVDFHLLLLPESHELTQATWGRKTLCSECGCHATAAPAICSAFDSYCLSFLLCLFCRLLSSAHFMWLLGDWGIDGHNSMISILFYLEGFSFRKRNPSNISATHVGHWRFDSRS